MGLVRVGDELGDDAGLGYDLAVVGDAGDETALLGRWMSA